MVFVCNLRNIHSFANVVILFAIKTYQPCHYIKPIARVYTRKCHANKTTRFWAIYGKTAKSTHNIQNISSERQNVQICTFQFQL